jgi:putative N6-adenine-specific DNA methylase
MSPPSASAPGSDLSLIATCSLGLEELLAEELAGLGVAGARTERGAVHWRGDWRSCWRANWRLRTANRVLVELASWQATEGEALSRGVGKLVADQERRWGGVSAGELFDPARTFSIRASTQRSPMRDERWIALKAKDGIVDAQRRRHGRRASVDKDSPDLPLRLRVADARATLLLDTSGEPLDRRGYRLQMVAAPLREQLAAACVLAAQWDGQGGAIADPMCGSGTLLAEAGWIARGQAPGSLRREAAREAGGRGWAFEGLPGFDAAAFAAVCREPIPRLVAEGELQLFGSDTSAAALNAAESNLRRAGLKEVVELREADAFELAAPAEHGLLVVNPPHGERLVSDIDQWKRLGDLLKQRWSGWRAVVLAGGEDRGKHLGLRPKRRISVKNGPLDVRIVVLDLY